MREICGVILLAFAAHAADAPAFAVASVKASARTVGKDYRKPIAVGEDRVSGRNVSLKDLLMVAYGMEPFRISGPGWIDENEYDLEARADGPVTRDQMRAMLQRLLTERFQMASHREQRTMKAHMLEPERGGFKAQAQMTKGFHSDIQELVKIISIQLTIPAISDPTRPSMASGPPVPVIDNTGLTGTYDFPVETGLEPGADMYEVWQRRLHEVGLHLVSRQIGASCLVVDRAEKVPTAN